MDTNVEKQEKYEEEPAVMTAAGGKSINAGRHSASCARADPSSGHADESPASLRQHVMALQ